MSAAVTTDQIQAESPPDVRGPTALWPLSLLALGSLALVLVLAGTLAIQIGHHISGNTLTSACKAAGLKPQVGDVSDLASAQNVGSQGVCNTVEGLRSGAETVVLVLGLLLGLFALAGGWGTYGRMDTRRKREHAISGAVLGVQAIVAAVFLLWFRSGELIFPFVQTVLNFTYLKGTLHLFIRGAGYTLYMAFISEFCGIALGLILALFVLSKRKVVRAPARIYINFFRGTPLIWQLSFGAAVISLGLGLGIGSITTAIIILSLNMGAYSAEVFRAGLQSIERGQMEAARSLGMTYAQAMRYAIVPQAVRRVIPPLMNEFVILIKDTSLIFVLGIVLGREELFGVGEEGFASTFNATYLVGTALGYLAVTLPLIGIVNAVERRLRSGLVSVGGQV